MNKKKPLTKQEHLECAKALRDAQKLLEPYMERFWEAYPVKDKRCKDLRTVLNILSSKLCCDLDTDWYNLPETNEDGHNTPYYGSGKIAW